MENTIEIMDRKIEKNNCSCMVCYIKVKLIGVHFDNPSKEDNIYITQAKIYDLIEKYGVKKVSQVCMIIETPELKYYIDLTK